MKILLINGSPKGKRSNSLKLAYSFIEGFKNGCTNDEESLSIDELHVASMNIAACKGCFACWQKTPGICCIKDDMQTVIEKLIDADLILWSFPLYYFNVPAILKNLIDRQLPMSLPFMSSRQDGSRARSVLVEESSGAWKCGCTCRLWSLSGHHLF